MPSHPPALITVTPYSDITQSFFILSPIKTEYAAARVLTRSEKRTTSLPSSLLALELNLKS